jgi:large subunit ribosomal protein L24
MRLRANDTVLIIKGRDRGKQGQIQRTFPKDDRVLVEGVNTVLRHTKGSPTVRQAGIIQKELPISAANVILVCTHCARPTRVGYKALADGTKARVCTRCQEVIE